MRRSAALVAALGIAVFLTLTWDGGEPAQAEQPDFADPIVMEMGPPGVSPAVRDLSTVDAQVISGRSGEVNPPRRGSLLSPVVGQKSPELDPLIRNGAASTTRRTPQTTLRIDGMSGAGVVPPDPVGDVGPNHYVQMVNSTAGSDFAVFDKSGILLAGPTSLSTLWAPVLPLSLCATSGQGDPIVLYDELADRWLLSQLAFGTTPPPFSLCIAISQTPDPTGGYFLYELSLGALPDYPKFAVWPDAYYMSANLLPPDVLVLAFERSAMIAGTVPSVVGGTVTGNFMLPADLDGITPAPGGAPNLFYTMMDDTFWPANGFPGADRLEVWEFVPDFATPANTTFTLTASLPTAAFDYTVCGFFVLECIPQPTPGETVEPLSAWPMWRLQYRNFGTYETLVGNFTVDVDGFDHAGIRWFELRRSGGGWSIFQEGTHAPDSDHRWMGSIAMDGDGNIALAYSVSGSGTFPSLRYATREAADVLGTLQTEQSLVEGGGVQTAGGNRWGDYSSMNVDPSDDCTFWYTGEYYDSTSAVSWKTRIGTFKVPSCGVAAVNNAPTVASPIADVTVDEDAADTVLDVSGTFADVDIGDSLTLSVAANDNPALVSASLVGTTLTLGYVADQNGVAHIAVRATDGDGAFVEDTFDVNVTAVNDDPTVANAIVDVTVDEDAAETVIALSSVFADVDIATNSDSLALSVAGNTNPSLVVASIAAGQLTLHYVADQNGTADITVRATDVAGAFVDDVFTVTVNPINDAPVAADDNATTGEDTAVNIPVLANDSDVDAGDTLTVATTTIPRNGSVVIAVDSTITYTPNAGFTGADSFTYRANDGLADSNVATVSITVVAQGGIALSIADSTTRLADATADAGQQVTMVVSASGTETMAGMEFDVLFDSTTVGAVSAVQGTAISGFSFAANTAVPGVVSILLAGATAAGIPDIDIALITFNVIGVPGSSTTLTFASLLAGDASAPPNPIPVTPTGGSITITPIAEDDAYSVDEGATLSVDAALGVLANDIDDGVLTAVKVTDPAHGTVALSGDGSFVYAHDGSETTSDSFTYKANDGLLDSSVATVNITVNPVNDAPLANDDSATVDEGGTVTVLDSTGTSVLANDTDAESDNLTAVLVSGPANGTLTLNADGTFSYTHDGGETTSDSFTYMANDGTDASNVATVTITVIPVMDVVPVAPPSVPPGRSFDVLIEADDATDLAEAQMTLSYDPALLAFDGVVLESALPGCNGALNDVSGAISLALVCGGGHSGVPLALWKATFTSSAVTVATTTELSITDVVAGDSQVPSQPIAAVGGTAIIAIVPGVCGDLNGDDVINVFDAIIELQIIVGLIQPTQAQMTLGDVVRDGTINVFDAILVLQHIVGLTAITDCGP